MENFPKPNKGGRPRKIPRSGGNPLADVLGEYSSEKQDFAREFFAEGLRSDRTRANAYYADGAREVIEAYSKQVQDPHDPVLAAKIRLGMDWILARRTVLTELGRMMGGEAKPAPEDIARLQDTVESVARRHDKLTAKAACAYISGRRMRETNPPASRKERVASLHHDLNAAINVHRQRHPESIWQDIKRALDLTTGQVERKLP
jgi:hypothetical protein